MARFTTALLVAAAVSTCAQSTIVTISDGLTTTLTLPAFPAPTSTVTETETSIVLSGETTTTTTVTSADSATLSIQTTNPGTTLTEINSSAVSSYVSSLLSEATATPSVNATITTTATSTSTFITTTTTVLPTGAGGWTNPNSTTGVLPPEFTGAATPVSFGIKEGVLGLFALGLVGLVGL